MGDDRVYEEWASRIVPRAVADGSSYRVFLGTVKWSDEKLRVAYTVFWQRTSEPNWRRAKSGPIDFKNPAHILEDGLDNVIAALRDLQRARPR